MNRSQTVHRRRKRKKKKKLKIGRVFLSLILLFLLIGGSYAGVLAYKANTALKNAKDDLGRNKSALREESVKPIDDNVSVLIIGVDENLKRGKEFGKAIRSDALLLGTFNKDEKTVKLVSIPRDTYTYLPITDEQDKIAHAHSYGNAKNGPSGGPLASVEAVENLLNIPVDYYVKFNFQSFMKIVDDLGGIEVDVPVTFSEQDSNDKPNAIHLEKGLQTLNGEEALALSRTRHIDNDMMRGQRQQLVLEAIVKKLARVGSLSKVDNLIESIDGQFKTDLTLDDILSFYKYGIGASIEKLQLEGEDNYVMKDGKRTYVYQPTEEKLIELSSELRNHLGLTP